MELVTFYAQRLVDRGRREGRQVHLPQLPAARPVPTSASPCSPTPGTCRPTSRRVVYARNLAGTEATAHFWFKLFPKKFRTRDVPDRRQADGRSSSLRSIPTGQLAPGPDMLVALRQDQQRDARARTTSSSPTSVSRPKRRSSGTAPSLHWGKEEADFADVRNCIYKGKKIDQAGAPRLRSFRRAERPRHTPPTTAAWCGPPTSAFTATASWWITATRCNPSTATCVRSTSRSATW